MFGYIREAPLANVPQFSRQALRGLLGGGPLAAGAQHAMLSVVRSARLAPPVAAAGPPSASSDARLLERCRAAWHAGAEAAAGDFDIRLSAVEAALWADTPAKESALNVWRQGVDAACQADLDARPVTCDEPVDPAPFAPAAGSSGEPLAEQGSAEFYGSPFAFNLRSGRMHLVVPRGLQVRAERPRAFCG